MSCWRPTSLLLTCAANFLIFGGCDEDERALNDLYLLDIGSTTWTSPATTGSVPSPRYGHSVTLLPAVRKVVVLGGTNGKLSSDGANDPEFPPHKTTAYLWYALMQRALLPKRLGERLIRSAVICSVLDCSCGSPMTVHILDIDSMAWSTVSCKNAGTGAEPPPRAYHSATLLGKNLFVTGGQVCK